MAISTKWKIKTWDRKPDCPFPADLFPEDSGLLMGPRAEPGTCTLVWLDGNSDLCWIQDLGLGTTTSRSVHFGQRQIDECLVTLTLNGTNLEGILAPVGEGNAGTFTAEASGPPFLEGEGPG